MKKIKVIFSLILFTLLFSFISTPVVVRADMGPKPASYITIKGIEGDYVACFAAKEAFGKALGIGISGGVTLREVEVKHDEMNKPFLELSGETKNIAAKFGVTKIHVSLTHEKDMAAAVVILE